ncbi:MULTISPECIES: MipA/OmpV family protein [Providencia]|uniref:MltA-interacting protein MipA n=2 Tax=Providencia rustigianii TaxID=158850 RepID=D1NYG9_9GAMM|nr:MULTISPECIES: MipA/OmpV family protein [Providencia]EFB73517.1 MltA-interacting protein MipA [Providencia rustigianii DSM 4541]MTC57609.1 MipA/OmpV family protein [Providencia rustigianii]MTC59121.1 MipA/OmpV family protein [Providencia rustigianii]SPY77703.1 MltA-interacting protein precursor [Providencia rustigianii]SUC27163.1 MltA-interacting protein precursor [Providencia rustigianii]
MSKTIKVTTLALVLSAMSSAAMAGTWSVGASVLAQATPYKGIKSSDYLTPVPMVNYESEDFYFRTLAVGYYLWNDKVDQISIDAYYYPQFFKPKENDNESMRKLDRRRDTVMGGFTYKHNADWGTLRFIGSGDMLGVSKGLRGEAAYLYSFKSNGWALTPGIGIKWDSEKQNRYEYGVSSKESRNSGLARYQPGSSWTPYVELSGNYRFADNWTLFAMGRVDKLSNEVKDSPMVNKSYSAILWSGVTYTF